MNQSQMDPAVFARLAKLDLSADETKQFSEQFPKILEYVGQLQSIEVPASVPEVRPSIVFRPDESSPSKVIGAILAEAPERQDDWWKVKAVFQ